MNDNSYSSEPIYAKRDFLIPLCIISLLFLPPLNFFLNGIIQTYYKGESVSSFFYIFMAICALYGYCSLFINQTPFIAKLIVTFLLIGTFFVYQFFPSIRSILIDDEFNPTSSQALMSVIYCIPAFVLAICCSNWKLVLKLARFFASIILILAILCYLVCSKDPEYILKMYMPFSYNLLLCTCLLFGDGCINGKVLESIAGLLGAFFITLVGARGAFACVSAFFILTFFITYRKGGRNSIILIVLLLIAGVAILPEKVSLLREEGLLNSRVLNSFESNAFFESRGRDEINAILWSSIKNNPFFGLGLYGDRIAGANSGHQILYAHNILTELICSFGIVFGASLFMLIVLSIFKNLKASSFSPYYITFISILPGGFLHLFFSGSFLIEISFWVLCGMMLNDNYMDK